MYYSKLLPIQNLNRMKKNEGIGKGMSHIKLINLA